MELLFQNILQALRSLRTQTWQVVISALGLAVSIVCLTFSANWLWSETNYDAFRLDYKDLYVLLPADSTGAKTEQIHHTLPVIERVKEVLSPRGDSVGTANTHRFFSRFRLAMARTDDEPQLRYYSCCYMDAAMLHTLGVEVLAGDINGSLRNRDERIVITDHMAMQLFGRTDVVGEALVNRTENKRHPVGAVIRANAGKSYFPYDFIMNLDYPEYYRSDGYCLFEMVVRSKDIDATMHALEGLKHPADGLPLYFSFAPLRTFAKLSVQNRLSSGSIMDEGGFLGAYFYQMAFVVISLLLLLGALANLIAVNTSICLSHTREYALRRSLGGSTWQNAQWLLTGIVPTLLLAVMLSAVAWEWMLKMQWVEIDTYRAVYFWGVTVLAAVVCCLLGMMYPIVKMHRIYKRSFAGSGVVGHSHGWLVAVQCVVCAFLLFLSWGMSRQLTGMMNEDMGLDTRNLLRLHTGITKPKELDEEHDFTTTNLFRLIPPEIKRHSGAGIVDAVAVRSDIFNRTSYRSVLLGSKKLRDEYVKEEHDKWMERHREELFEVDYMELEYGVQQFFGLRTAKGRQMDKDVSHEEPFVQVFGDKQLMERVGRDATRREPLYIIADHEISPRGFSYINNTVKHWLGREVRIVDEVRMNTTDFHQQRIPTIYVGVPDGHKCHYIETDAIYIRYAEGRQADAEAAVRQVLHDMGVPEDKYLLTTFEEYMSKSYEEDVFYANLVSWLTTFCFLITLAGVFCTLLYALRLRRRSIAIHRVMGAEFKEVFVSTLRPYIIYAVLGSVVAYVPAVLLMRKWMSYFSYGTAPGIGLMSCILLLMLAVITIIVWWQVRLCMLEKPVEILRPES